MNKAPILATLLLFAALPARPQSVTGDWQGTLQAGAASLHLVLHVSRDKGGVLKASLDSVDQGAFGIPITSIALQGSKLTFAADSVHGSYEGLVAADGKSIAGTWTQGAPLPLDFTRLAKPATRVKPSDLEGDWLGTLQAGAAKLRVVFHIFNTTTGLRATFASIDQSPQRIPVSQVARSGSQITMEVGTIGGKFAGTVNPDRTEIRGTWTQGSASLPLILKLTKNTSELRSPPRPQNPRGAVGEYQEIATTIAPVALEKISGWIL